MKSTTITLLAAAFASLSSAASTAATALPAKFTLSYTSSGTDLPASGTIVKDEFYGSNFPIPLPPTALTQSSDLGPQSAQVDWQGHHHL